jgi:hypothetical protein
MKTAMQWLQERYNNNINLTIEDFKEALEIEKEQIMNSYREGVNAGILYCNGEVFISKEEYYNQTYNN